MSAEGAVSFATDIRPLFREKDVRSMSRHFDLTSYVDVSTVADRILGRLRSGSMPCDGEWPSEQVDLFERWIRGGKKP
jgi:hypothetical protein